MTRLENIATKGSKLERRGTMVSIDVKLRLSHAFSGARGK